MQNSKKTSASDIWIQSKTFLKNLVSGIRHHEVFKNLYIVFSNEFMCIISQSQFDRNGTTNNFTKSIWQKWNNKNKLKGHLHGRQSSVLIKQSFPSYPFAQVQVYDPLVLTQVAPFRQGDDTMHSSMSSSHRWPVNKIILNIFIKFSCHTLKINYVDNPMNKVSFSFFLWFNATIQEIRLDD